MQHMEEEKAQEQSRNPKKIHFSLFKRRRKAKVRSIVINKKNVREKQFYGIIFVIIIILFVATGFIYGVKQIANLSIFQGEKKPVIVPIIENEATKDDIIKAFNKTHLQINDIKNASNSGVFEIKLENGPKVIISSLKDVDEQVALIDSIIRRFTIENKNPNVIDLRYNKPIVKF